MLDFIKENTVLLRNKYQGIRPTNMLESLVNQNSSVSDSYMEYIPDMIFQLHHLHLEQYFIQQQHDPNLRHLLALLSLYFS